MTTTPAAPNTGGRAKNKFLSVAVLVALTALPARDTRADSTFGGSLCSSSNQGPVLIAGSIGLTVDRGQVSFTSKLFKYCVAGTTLEPVLVVHNKVFPLPFGTGTPGNWWLQEFLWPFPAPAPCGPPPGIDPGFEIPPSAGGTRFTGSFTTHPDLEHSLLAKGGTVLIQVHGVVGPLQNPIFSATLQHVTTPIPIPFTANLSGANERPPNASPFRGSGTFTLTGNCFAYSLTVPTNFAWSSVGVFGPAGPHSTSTNLVAAIGPLLGVLLPGASQVTYSGEVPLTDEAVGELKRGRLYVNFATAQYPQGELRGQILPLKPVHEDHPDRR